MQDGIFEELMKEEASPTMPEEEEEPSYDFGALNEMDDATWHLLKLIDVVELEQLMLEKVSKSQRRPTSSWAHPNKSPFTLG